jgi:hypothetical protein
MPKPVLSRTNGHQRRKRQLDSLRTFLLGCAGRTMTSAGTADQLGGWSAHVRSK